VCFKSAIKPKSLEGLSVSGPELLKGVSNSFHEFPKKFLAMSLKLYKDDKSVEIRKYL